MAHRHENVVVVGQGYVGLPLAMRAVEAGHSVVGIDVDSSRVAHLAAGESFVEDVSGEQVRSALASERYAATTDYTKAAGFTIAIITVPTPLKESLPDLSYIENAASALGGYLRRGATVVLESTTYPGTTQELLVPILEKTSGLCAGDDFSVGYSPERIDPGNPTWGLVNTPKVVSGIDARSLAAVQGFYDTLVERTVPVSSPREAELSKLLENTFRHVNIALVNELAIYANELGVDVWEAIDAAASKPFGFMKFTPGPGVGGHCLPVDPSYLSWQVRRTLGRSFRFVELANDVNDHQPDYVVQRTIEMLNQRNKSLRDARILIIGVSYKKNSGDLRESPALRIIDLLAGYGAILSATDPYVIDNRWPSAATRVELTSETLRAQDIAILVTDHDDFDFEMLAATNTPLLDTRNRVHGKNVRSL